MWADVETGRDFLNFNVMASLVSQMILDAKGQALSIGISGGWGVGKSSMVKLVEADLRARIEQEKKQNGEKAQSLLFVNFNAWLYQGHDDAKAALMEEIADALTECAKKQETSVEKGVKLLKRIDFFRTMRVVGELAATVYTGVPIGALARAGKGIYDSFNDGDISSNDYDSASSEVEKHTGTAQGLVKPADKRQQTPPQMIHAIRSEFEELLERFMF